MCFRDRSGIVWRNAAFLLLVAGCLITLAPQSTAATLTGAVVYSTDLVDYWATLGNNYPAAALYLQDSPGHWVNSGYGQSTSIDISLEPGTYTYAIFGQPGENRAINGLNLFFDGDNSDPRISADANIASASDLNPPISPFAGTSYTLSIGKTPGSGTLSYIDGATTITLTNFVWAESSLQNLDVVQYFDNTPAPGGAPSNIGLFTLVVSGAPEPYSFLLTGVGLSVLLIALVARSRAAGA